MYGMFAGRKPDRNSHFAGSLPTTLPATGPIKVQVIYLLVA